MFWVHPPHSQYDVLIRAVNYKSAVAQAEWLAHHPHGDWMDYGVVNWRYA